MKTQTILSRRRLLAGMPAAAVMAPAVASTADGDDAELLELGRKLAPLVAEINGAKATDRICQAEYKAKLASVGLKGKEEYPDARAYMDERSRLIKENKEWLRAGRVENNGHRDWADIWDNLFALVGEILDFQPTTVEGFAVQVLAITTANDDLCDEEANLPFGVAAFFQNACRFAGVPVPV